MSPDAPDARSAPPPRPGRAAERNIVFGAAVAGFFVGAVAGQSPFGALVGAVLGAVLALWRAADRRAQALEDALEGLARRLESLERRGGAHRPAGEGRPAPDVAAERRAQAEPPGLPPPPAPAMPIRAARAPRAATGPAPPSPLAPLLAAVRDFLLGGNTVVRVGILVLLIGVALLAKWAADHALFPIEARLAAAAAIGVTLAAIGVRLRERRPGFATTLQGGGIAALYLVVFFAFRAYALVPAGLAFALFVAIALACAALALLQRSQPLVFIGSVGGFAAPVLASTGAGNHVVLFSYYLLLDAGIAAVAWRESWRALNLLAFVSTWGVATAWGVLRYRPEQLASTEPFLLAFWALFTGVALVMAWRRPPHLTGFVDGTLVFGTPLVALLAQARLLEGRQLAMALSTAGFALAYALLATFAWRRAPALLRRLVEAFVALALVFGTIAIPLALDDALATTLAWSLEGAGVYWIGARQRRPLARAAGVALQGLAALSFAVAAHRELLPLANPRFLSCAALAAAGLFIAREAHAARERLARREWRATQALAGWALLWAAGGAHAEIDAFLARPWHAAAALGVLAVVFPALELGAARLAWTPGRLWAAALLPFAFLAIPFSLARQGHLLEHGGALAWPLVLVATWHVLGRIEACAGWARWAWAPALWLAALVAALGLGGLAEEGLALSGDWPPAAFGLGLAAVLLAAGLAAERGLGVFGRHPDVHLGAGAAPAAALALAWTIVLNLAARGDAAPISHLPLANPTDVAIALLLAAALDAWLRLRRAEPPLWPGPWRRVLPPLFAALAFGWLNGILARAVHQWSDIPFRAEALWSSTPLHVALSISWTLVALAGMLLATRRGWRAVWLAASTLLGVTVVKLFLVDLSTLSTVARIATFLVVGALLLVVGYLSPVPPARRAGAGGGAGGAALARPERGGAP